MGSSIKVVPVTYQGRQTMKKRILFVFALLANVVGPSYGQGMMFRDGNGTLKNGTQSGNSSFLMNSNESKGEFIFTFVGGMHIAEDNNSIQFQGEFGHMFSEIPLFLTPGFGYKSSNSWGFGEYNFGHIIVPLYLGYLIGDREKLHASIRGGVVWNYLVRAKYDDSSLNLDNYKRSSWNGSIRFALGWDAYTVMVQYDFPFSSDGDGVWMFGWSAPF